MIQTYKKRDLGHVQTDWLDTRHHFSFGHYLDENRMGFGNLRVVNDDLIRAGSGFGTHPHRNMEIITYVRTGTVIHKDSMGNHGKTAAGDVQVMTAGKGIAHSEYADADAVEDTKLYQIWIEPRETGLEPAWDQAEFPKTPVSGALNLLVSGRTEDKGANALHINQDAAIFGGKLGKETALTQILRGKQAYVLVSYGTVALDGEVMEEGDGAEISAQDVIEIKAMSDAEILVIEL